MSAIVVSSDSRAWPRSIELVETFDFRSSDVGSGRRQTKGCSERNQPNGKVLAPAERENRIEDQRLWLSGLRLRGDEEVAHQCFDAVLSMMEKDPLVHVGPERFVTRRHELQIAIDAASLIVKDRRPPLTCPAVTELEVVNAFRHRALAFVLVRLRTSECPASAESRQGHFPARAREAHDTQA